MSDQPRPNGAQSELRDWLGERQAGLHVTRTTITPGGHTLDWVPIESQTGEPIATPPPDGLPRASLADSARPTEYPGLDTGEAGPPGHVPILRPDVSKVRQLEDLRSKRGGLLVNPNRRNKEPTDPNPAGYFHASSSQSTTLYGCDAWLNVWDPAVDIPSSPGDDHSISQTWLQNYSKPKTQSLEGGLTVDKSLNGDAYNHLFTYYTTNGYTKDGDNIGGYNRLEKGWIQYHASIYPGIRINGSSVQGGTQLEIGIKYQLYQGNWWFGFNNNESGPWIWLGYYPASLYGGGLGNVVQWVAFGGEVYSALANPCSTTDQMGSGRHAADGWSHAAYQRNLHNQSNTGGTVVNFNGVSEVDTAASGCPANAYTIQTFMNSGSSWASYQYYGGPAS
ncbi:MAG: neprosin family prolyl endopeptidase [Chloroflexi bacterium]|nr:neprosin family prolyl endopeptidase [Chloroflexota bacterium]